MEIWYTLRVGVWEDAVLDNGTAEDELTGIKRALLV